MIQETMEHLHNYGQEVAGHVKHIAHTNPITATILSILTGAFFLDKPLSLQGVLSIILLTLSIVNMIAILKDRFWPKKVKEVTEEKK